MLYTGKYNNEKGLQGVSLQFETIKRKSHSAISEHQTIEMTRQEQAVTLAQFIAKLSLTCKGIARELDYPLASIREQLQPDDRIQELGSIISELTALKAFGHDPLVVKK
ncbi:MULTISPECIES: hypothetical protein [unclassified Pseudoalteromonas]|uniref:hypothetical protein n=1 Tax=unclassified Pseudoalteromonas TaxID=194690 RepID=UPI000CF66D9A|nr:MULTISPECIES: hypothetical protein [unclassified Pseudoalteromonas]